MRRTGLSGLALALATLASSATATPVVPATLSVMTYNVEGLPWPVRWGRDAAFTQMTRSLADLRARGAQPRVIVLQEAFTPAAKAIAAGAGYRYVTTGPAADQRGNAARLPADRNFAAAADPLIGEGVGKWADSGLVIASDYPVLSVRRMAFPDYACAGLDCLANKGALVVTLAVPGTRQPVAVVATHLNSMIAAHVPVSRSLYAYRRQVDALTDFVRTSVPAGSPLILAGDFNAGFRFARRSYLVTTVGALPRVAPVSVALDNCIADARCAKADLRDLRTSYRRGRDWQFFWSGLDARLAMTAMSVPFGHDAAGRMLSDHVGYTASYTLTGRGLGRLD